MRTYIHARRAADATSRREASERVKMGREEELCRCVHARQKYNAKIAQKCHHIRSKVELSIMSKVVITAAAPTAVGTGRCGQR